MRVGLSFESAGRTALRAQDRTHAGGASACRFGPTPGASLLGAAVAQALRHPHRNPLRCPRRVDPTGRTEPQLQRLSAQSLLSRFPPYRPPRKRKREIAPFAPAEDRALQGWNPSADWSLANSRGRAAFFRRFARFFFPPLLEQGKSE